MLLNKIHLKRLKRKRKLQARMRCHGDKGVCTYHIKPLFRKPVIEVKKEIKLKWWQKLFIFLTKKW